MTDTDVVQAARLIHWALPGKERPATNDEYGWLVARYQQDYDFQRLVHEIADGLQIKILAAGPLGLVIVPMDGSTFAYRAGDFRRVHGAEDRLLDGLAQVAIAATIYPRAVDLEADALQARLPTTVAEVEQTLRTLTDRLKEKAASAPDPTEKEETEGLIEAWRVYDRMHATRETKENRQAFRTTHRLIQTHLDALVNLGCFSKTGDDENAQYRALWKYQVLVKDLAATKLYDAIARTLGGPN